MTSSSSCRHTVKIHLLSFVSMFTPESQCWERISVFCIEEDDSKQNKKENMEPADKKSRLNWAEFLVCVVYPDEVGIFTFRDFKTCSERISGRPQEEDEQWKGKWLKRGERGGLCDLSLGSRPELVLFWGFFTVPPFISSAVSESINKTWWDRGRERRCFSRPKQDCVTFFSLDHSPGAAHVSKAE